MESEATTTASVPSAPIAPIVVPAEPSAPAAAPTSVLSEPAAHGPNVLSEPAAPVVPTVESKPAAPAAPAATSTTSKSNASTLVGGKPANRAPTSEIVQKSILAVAESAQCPKQVAPYLVKAAPFAGKAVEAIENAIPLIQKLIGILEKYYEIIKPYRPDLLLPSFMGLIMCFFGGSYLTVIAAWEAFLMCGYDSTKACVLMLIDDLQKVAEANKKDDIKDEDNDGVADVLQVSNQQLLQRKMLLFLRTLDPQRVTVAIAGINAGFLAVIATLKLQFAKTITLGNSIGSALEPPAKEYALPIVEKLLPPEYRKWAWPLISYSIRSIAISIAWFVQRIISAFHSAIRGGLMFSRNIMKYLTEMNIYKIRDEESILDELVGYGLAALGLWFQLSMGFAVPFPLNVILFPFTLIEYFLIWAVTNHK